MQEPYTQAAKDALDHAATYAKFCRHGYIGTEHLFYALLCTKTETGAPCVAAHLLSSHGVTEPTAKLQLAQIPALSDTPADCVPTPLYARVLVRARTEAARFPCLPEHGNGTEPLIGTEHLLFALLCEADCAAAHLITAQNVPLHELYGDVLSFLSAVSAEVAILSDDGDTKSYPAIHCDRSAAAPQLYLSPMQREKNALPVIGREKETEEILRILLRRTKNNPCLIGDAGVGKTAIVEGLAERLAQGKVPKPLIGKRILSLDLAAMLAGTRYRGDFEERIRNIVAYCETHKDVILFLDELHTLMGAGSAEGAIDASNLLKPALSRGTLRLIGATTAQEYRRFIEGDAAMARRFCTVLVDEPSEDDAYRMLLGVADVLASHHGVCIPSETVRAAIRLSVRYLPDRHLPDKALDLLDDACAAHRAAQNPSLPHSDHDFISSRSQIARDVALRSGDLATAEFYAKASAPHERNNGYAPTRSSDTSMVTTRDIADAVTRKTGIILPEDTTDASTVTPKALRDALCASIIGQRAAITALCDAYLRLSAGLSPLERPRGSFLFTGPTGVGKTALSLSFARTVFGDDASLLRFDMSEYMEKNAVSALIGTSPGYVGYEGGGHLTEAVHRHPYSVLLFDEIEKAHPDVLHLFLQLLDAGRLTDSHGRHIDFRHTFVFMTTNAGTQPSGTALGFAPAVPVSPAVTDMLSATFPREFLNRFDAIIPFSPLTRDNIAKITVQKTDDLVRRAANRGIALSFTKAALAHLSENAFTASKEFGARPIARILTDTIETPLSSGIVAGTYKAGDHVTVRVRRGKITMTNLGSQQ